MPANIAKTQTSKVIQFESRRRHPERLPLQSDLALIQRLRSCDQALKPREVAALLNCSDQTVYRMMQDERQRLP